MEWVVRNLSDFVIPSEARDLHFAANCRSFASLRMTMRIYETRAGRPRPHERLVAEAL